MIELLKILVQAVVIERDEDGKIIGERVAPAVPLYTLEQLSEYVTKLSEEIPKLSEEG